MLYLLQQTNKEETKMVKTIYETNNYRRELLFESETVRILFVSSKTNSNMDRIIIIKMGDEYREPNTIVVYRYEDKELFNHMLDIYYNN